MTDSKTLILELLRDLGQRQATELRQSAADLSGTEIIAYELSLIHI